ncbi:MAG TPA: oligosaccharide flippase family protein [Isosphaeraceae bacterium]|jgi:O-antigen/teichoic acid export membrane protein|nr:oligosaccharide flippase family protein [Isosphaeraceae bacterium]
MTTLVAPPSPPIRRRRRAVAIRPRAIAGVVAAEVFAGVLGFAATVHLARRLGPDGFARVELAGAIAAWLLVIVRGGVESIVQREAARRPRLIHRLTEQLLGLKCALAAVASGIALIAAMAAGPLRGPVIAVAALVLVPSALVPDVAPRALGRLGPLAIAQVMRALAMIGACWSLVAGPGQALRGAACAVVAEGAACLVLSHRHASWYGPARPRFRRRAWLALLRRGAIASLSRFGRVSLFAIDAMALGWCASAAFGPYAAARRIVFAIAAVGLVVPAAVAPAIARAWAFSEGSARALVAEIHELLLALAIPAAVGLAVTGPRWMPWIFGAEYAGGGRWLALTAARLPWLLAASLAQAALIACRREREALRLIATVCGFGVVLVPITAWLWGTWGVGLAVLALELAATIGGWIQLDRLRIAPPLHDALLRALAGSVPLAAVGLAFRPLWLACPLAALAYGATWFGVRRACRC